MFDVGCLMCRKTEARSQNRYQKRRSPETRNQRPETRN